MLRKQIVPKRSRESVSFELSVSVSSDGGPTYLVRQEFNFSPPAQALGVSAGRPQREP
jgi:hypothetical protein